MSDTKQILGQTTVLPLRAYIVPSCKRNTVFAHKCKHPQPLGHTNLILVCGLYWNHIPWEIHIIAHFPPNLQWTMAEAQGKLLICSNGYWVTDLSAVVRLYSKRARCSVIVWHMTFIPAGEGVPRTGHIHYLQRQKDPEWTTHNCNRSTDVVEVLSAPAPASLSCCLWRGSTMKAERPSSVPLSPWSNSCNISTADRICSGLSTAGPALPPAAQHGTLHPSISSCRSHTCSVVQSPSSAAMPRTRCPWPYCHLCPWGCLGPATQAGHGFCSASWNPVPVKVAPKSLAAAAAVQSMARCPQHHCPWLMHLQCSLGPVTWASALAYMQDDTGPNAHGISACCLSLCNVVQGPTVMA